MAVEAELLEGREVARRLCITTRSLWTYVSRLGMPCNGSGRERRFVWRDALEWYIQHRFTVNPNGGRHRPGRVEARPRLGESAVASEGAPDHGGRVLRWPHGERPSSPCH